ncbi:MAG TPA: hypothetical protein PKA06_06445, partial [Gemmatales bacterium]|nr:hypothetical protein [Gemmatales bacterium]
APLLQGGLITERGARAVTMLTQDTKIPLRLGADTGQARLKATLQGMGIPISPSVKPPLPTLSSWDRLLVRQVLRKLER